MRILFLSRWFPYPPDNGSRIRIYNLIKSLSLHHEIHLVSFAEQTVSDDQLAVIRHYCRGVEVVRYRPFQPDRWTALLGFFSRRPRSVIDTYSLEMEKLLRQIAREYSFDVVITSEFGTAPYYSLLPNIPKILEEVELTIFYENVIKQKHPLKKFRTGLTWWKLSRYAANLLRDFDGCTVVSEKEREHILELLSDCQRPIRVIPNGVDISHCTANFGPPEDGTLIYSGALTYAANFDAMEYFLGNVFPLIQAERPDVKLFITGKLDGVPINRLPRRDGVIFTGYLDDIRPRVAQSWVSIVPLRIGGGTRLKILEAMALGTPVVATSKGAEGLDLVPNEEILIADGPADFAAVVLRLLQDAALRKKLSLNGRQAVEAKYDWQFIGQQFNNFVETIVAGRTKGNGAG